jgi:tetratricopeptide (TPR) repeat protein
MGLLVTNRPNALVWAAALPLLLAVSMRRERRGLLRAAAVLGGLVLAVGPVAVRNRVVSGEWILVSSHGGLNFFIGNNRGADGTYKPIIGITPSISGQAEDARRVAEKATGRPLSTAEVSAYFYRIAGDWISREPSRAVGLFLRKLAYVFNALDLPLNNSYAYFSRDEPTLLRALLVGPGLLVPLGLLGLAGVPRRDPAPGYGVWAAFVPVYAVSVAAFFVAGRYRLPLLVPLCVGAGAAGVWLYDQACARRARPLLAAAAGLALLGLAANWDWGRDDGRGEERTQMIVRFVDEGRYDEARGLLARTRPTHPEPARLLFRVGQAFRDQGRAEDAAEMLEEALRVDPTYPEVRHGLARAREENGVALSLAGQHAEGAAELEEAVRLEPTSASAQLNLAVVYAQLRRYDDARARAEEALRLRPDYPQARGLLEQLRR